MKSQYVAMLTKVAAGIFRDAELAYSRDLGFSRDIDKLKRLSETRGIGLYLFDLPNVDTILLDGLAKGRLTLEGPLSKRVSAKVLVPRFASGLWLRVFDKSGVLLQEVDENAILFLRQVSNLFKKLELPCSPKRLETALNEYRLVDQSLRVASLDWVADDFECGPDGVNVHFVDAIHLADRGLPLFQDDNSSSDERDRILLHNLQRTADEISAVLPLFNAISASCVAKSRGATGRGVRHGPGAVAHKSGTVDKYGFPNFPRKLSRVFPRLYAFTEMQGSFAGANHEVPARLIAVPKTAKAPRLIAAEPVEHQYYQQLLLNWFNIQFGSYFSDFINLKDQETSKKMAQSGSCDGSLATVDLSSASDRLSCWTVERMFRGNPSLLSALQSCRTRWVRNDVPGTTPYFLKIKKYASQGTACTFPVQTLVFLAIALSVCDGLSLKQKMRLNRGTVRVFGDDIIIPNTKYDSLVRLLELLQLKVNPDKSFHSGFFRESCGGDYYLGRDVTPVKIKRIGATSPEDKRSMVDASNNLHERGFWRTAQAIGYLLPLRVLNALPVVSMSSGSTGRRSFVGGWYQHLPLRWNAGLSSVEYRSWDINTVPTRIDRSGLSRLRKYLSEAPRFGLMDANLYDSDLLGRPSTRDGIRWRALEPIAGFRANR